MVVSDPGGGAYPLIDLSAEWVGLHRHRHPLAEPGADRGVHLAPLFLDAHVLTSRLVVPGTTAATRGGNNPRAAMSRAVQGGCGIRADPNGAKAALAAAPAVGVPAGSGALSCSRPLQIRHLAAGLFHVLIGHRAPVAGAAVPLAVLAVPLLLVQRVAE